MQIYAHVIIPTHQYFWTILLANAVLLINGILNSHHCWTYQPLINRTRRFILQRYNNSTIFTYMFVPLMARCTRYNIMWYRLSVTRAAGQGFSVGTPVSFTNKPYLHDIAEILLKVALNTITITLTPIQQYRQKLA